MRESRTSQRPAGAGLQSLFPLCSQRDVKFAVGNADGKLQKRAYPDKPENKDEEYFMKLRNFEVVSAPLRATEIKRIPEIDYRFMGTMFALNCDGGKALERHIHERQELTND